MNLLLCHAEMHSTELYSIKTDFISISGCMYIYLNMTIYECMYFLQNEYFITSSKLAAVTAVKSDHFSLFASQKEHYQLVPDTTYPGKC